MSISAIPFVVCGYIRRTEKLLSENAIIPDSIFHLCSLFWIVPNILFIKHYNYKLKSIELFNIDTKDSLNIKLNKPLRSFCHIPIDESAAYVPNISHHLSNLSTIYTQKLNVDFKSETYDGFVGSMKINNSYHASIMLFHADYFHFFVSKKRMPTSAAMEYRDTTTFCNCSTTHGVIYMYNGILYQLKPQEITCNNFNFKTMKSNSKNVKVNRNCGNVNLRYLSNYDKLFVISHYRQCSDSDQHIFYTRNKQKSSCAIFDLHQKRWNLLPQVPLKDYYNSINVTCYDDINGQIYVIANNQSIVKYDCNLNKWNQVYSAQSYYRSNPKQQHMAWLSKEKPNILQLATLAKGVDFVTLRNFDLRAGSKWTTQGKIEINNTYMDASVFYG